MPLADPPASVGYGIDEAVAEGTWEALPWTWASERLVRNRNYWVVTVSASGRPHALPVWGVWMAEAERFVFSCSSLSRKARNIAANPQVVVTVDDTVECVSVEGRAVPIVEGADREAVLDAYAAKYEPEVPGTDLRAFVGSQALFEVVPDRAFAMIERADEFATRATRWRW